MQFFMMPLDLLQSIAKRVQDTLTFCLVQSQTLTLVTWQVYSSACSWKLLNVTYSVCWNVESGDCCYRFWRFSTQKEWIHYKRIIYLFKQLLRHGSFSSSNFLQLAVLEWEEIASVGIEAFAWYSVGQRQLPLLVSITNIFSNQYPFSYC